MEEQTVDQPTIECLVQDLAMEATIQKSLDAQIRELQNKAFDSARRAAEMQNQLGDLLMLRGLTTDDERAVIVGPKVFIVGLITQPKAATLTAIVRRVETLFAPQAPTE